MDKIPSDPELIFQKIRDTSKDLFKQLSDEQRKGRTGNLVTDQIVLTYKLYSALSEKNNPIDSSFKETKFDVSDRVIENKQYLSNALQHYLGDVTVNDITICTMAMISSVFIVLQTIELRSLWNGISLARNIRNRTTIFEPIETNITMLQATVARFTQAIQSNDMTQVAAINIRARTEYTQTKTLINDLQMEINESLQRLDVPARGQVFKGIGNLSLGVGSSIILYTLFQRTSKMATIWSIATAVGLVVLTGIDVKCYRVAKNYSNQLQQHINNLEGLNARLDQLFSAV